MRANYLSYSFLLLSLASCTNRSDDVVCESYHHRYGVALPANEWSERGRNGQVISTLKDGVVVTRTYDAGVLDGESTYTFPHRETIERREIYSQGTLTQEIFCSSAGLPIRQVSYHSPSSRSVVIWYDNGAPQCQEEYDNQILVNGEYFTQNNHQESVVMNGNGTRVYRDQYGEMGYVDAVESGQIQRRTTYHSGGTPESITPYMNNTPEGLKQTYLPGGEPRSMERWVKGQQHGMTVYYENGEKSKEMPFVNGKRQGIETRYRDDGQTVCEKVSWVNDNKHGPSHAFVGGEKQTDWYYRDQKVNKATFDALRNQE